jgi:hypothetical protein
MKNILIGLFVLLSISVFAQKKTDKILEKRVGNLSILYQKITYIDNDKITYMVFFVFQNDKYRSITDTKVIGLYSVADVEQCTKDMINVYKQMSTGEKTNMDWAREEYKMTLFDFSNSMYFAEAKGTGGYTIMPKNAVSNFIKTISTIDFGKETLLTAKTIDELIQ